MMVQTDTELCSDATRSQQDNEEASENCVTTAIFKPKKGSA